MTSKAFSGATSHRIRNMLICGIAACGMASTTAIVASAQSNEAAGDMAVLSFTEEQVDRGEDVYDDNCSGCHGSTLGGGGETPGLVGNGFRNRWFDDTPHEFFDYISRTMPQQAPGSLTPEEYADVMVFILDKNGYPGGETELPADAEVLATLTFPERPE